MPKKLMDCVNEVKKEKPEDQAFPICISATGQKPHKEKKKTEKCVKKSLDDRIKDLLKATIHHKDSNTFTDVSDMSLAKLTTPKSYQEYIEEELKGLGIGESKTIFLKEGKQLKIYKVEDGIYSGHIDAEDGTIFHNIDRVTIPEIVNHLVTKETAPLVEEEEEKESEESRQVIININISKSEENIMDNLDSRIDALYKAAKEETKEEKKVVNQEDVSTGEEELNNLEQDPGRKKLVSDIIALLNGHNKKGHSQNVNDIAKFLVHLHRDENDKEEEDDKEVNKSVSEIVSDLRKSDKIKLTKDENVALFNLELEDMIRNEYMYLKRNNTPEDKIKEELKKRVNKRVLRRMTWEDKFLLAKRAVGYDEKYLSSILSSFDFKALDEEFEEMNSPKEEAMCYSKEAYKIFEERKGVSTAVLDTLEKGNNFFKGEIQSPKLAVEFYEKDYETMAKGRIEKYTDSLTKSNIDSKIRK